MKTFNNNNITSINCFIIAGFCLALSLVCAFEWRDIMFSIGWILLGLAFGVVAFLFVHTAYEEYEQYKEDNQND